MKNIINKVLTDHTMLIAIVRYMLMFVIGALTSMTIISHDPIIATGLWIATMIVAMGFACTFEKVMLWIESNEEEDA